MKRWTAYHVPNLELYLRHPTRLTVRIHTITGSRRIRYRRILEDRSRFHLLMHGCTGQICDPCTSPCQSIRLNKSGFYLPPIRLHVSGVLRTVDAPTTGLLINCCGSDMVLVLGRPPRGTRGRSVFKPAVFPTSTAGRMTLYLL